MLSMLLARNARADDAPLVPKLDDRWRTIATSPDLGELTSDQQQPVDFAIWQAAGGSWQLWSCVRGTKERGKTRLFYRWEGKRLTDADWKPMGIAMRAETLGETPGGLEHLSQQGPAFVRHQRRCEASAGDAVCGAGAD